LEFVGDFALFLNSLEGHKYLGILIIISLSNFSFLSFKKVFSSHKARLASGSSQNAPSYSCDLFSSFQKQAEKLGSKDESSIWVSLELVECIIHLPG
jgi:hypothetical protein